MTRSNPLSDPGAFEETTGRRSRSEADDIIDLCTTCDHSVLCLSRKTLRRPVIFCEQFEANVPPRRAKPTAPPPRLRPVRELEAEARREELSEGYTGICGNCDQRQVCPHSHDEGGIWHCEEYS